MKHFLFLIFFLPIFGHSQIGTVQLSDLPIPTPSNRVAAIDSMNSRNPGFSSLNAMEKDLFYWVNFSRMQPKRFWEEAIAPILKQFPTLNGANARSLRADLSANNELPPFLLNRKLINTAQRQAKDNALQGRINHSSANGKQFSQRMQEAGIKHCAAENLSSSPDNMLFALTLLYLDIGVKDLGHRKNLMSSMYQELGLGVARKDADTFFSVMDFACSQ